MILMRTNRWLTNKWYYTCKCFDPSAQNQIDVSMTKKFICLILSVHHPMSAHKCILLCQHTCTSSYDKLRSKYSKSYRIVVYQFRKRQNISNIKLCEEKLSWVPHLTLKILMRQDKPSKNVSTPIIRMESFTMCNCHIKRINKASLQFEYLAP